MDNFSKFKLAIEESIDVKNKILKDSNLLDSMDLASKHILKSLKKGNFLYFCGNGGSASDAQHIAAELSGKLYNDRAPQRAILLGSNFSSLTAISNDYGYDHIFSREIDGYGVEGDILLSYSTSGKSKNVLNAINKAKEKGLFIISFTGNDGGEMLGISDICINIPSSNTPRIQECHIMISHIILDSIDKFL